MYKLMGSGGMKKLADKLAGFAAKYRREIIVTLALCFICALPWLINNPAIIGASATKRELPIYCVERDNKSVSLTFDAAWGNEDTELLIEILGAYNVKATFFVVGDWVEKYPESVRALYDDGHEIMNHSNKHEHFTRLNAEEIVNNLETSNEKIRKITGVTPKLFRCPYGEYDDHVISTVNSIDMTTIQWDVDSLDWKEISAEEIKERVLSRVNSGSIVLFHNAALHTPEALPGIIEGLLTEGYEIVPVTEILLDGEYTIDHTGRQMAVKK